MLQTTMRVQQFVTGLALKGDEALRAAGSAPTRSSPSGPRSTRTIERPRPAAERRHQPLRPVKQADGPQHYSSRAGADADSLADRRTSVIEPPRSPPRTGGAPPPGDRDPLDYANHDAGPAARPAAPLSVEESPQLLDFEQQTRARAPFVTMLANRIATVQAQ